MVISDQAGACPMKRSIIKYVSNKVQEAVLYLFFFLVFIAWFCKSNKVLTVIY